MCTTRGNAGTGYRLDGVNVTTNVTHMIEAVLYNVTQSDAQAINDRIGHLTLAQVYAALAYYHLNQDEIDRDLAEEEAIATALEEQAARTSE